MAKTSYADRVRQKQKDKASKAAQKGTGDPREWTPVEGSTRIRVLPPLNFTQDTFNASGELVGKKGEEDDFFYMTHSYHFFEGIGADGKGKLLWTPKYFDVDGKRVQDPVDVAVAKMYDTARKTKDNKLKDIAGKIKRKHQYFASIIKYENKDDEVGEYRILKDTSNEGKLIKQICMNMGFPFYRDVQTEWVDKASLEVDEDRNVYDLVDVNDGHDFKIKKDKTGAENWDFTYESSIPIPKSRSLSDEELEYLEERIDLRNFIQYCTYEEVCEALEEFMSTLDDIDDEDEDEDESLAKKAKDKIKNSKAKSKVMEDDDEDEDEEEDEKPAKSKTKNVKKSRPVEDDEEEDEDIDLSDLDDEDE